MQEQQALEPCLLDALDDESSPMHPPSPRISDARRGSGASSYSHLRPSSLPQTGQLVPRSVSSTQPSRFSDNFGAAVGALPPGCGRVSHSRSGAALGGAVSAAGPASLRSVHTAAFSLRSSLRDDGVGSFDDDDVDADSLRLDHMSDALTQLFMAGLQTGSNGSRGPSQAERLIQDLTELRLLGRGGCGYVYKVGS